VSEFAGFPDRQFETARIGEAAKLLAQPFPKDSDRKGKGGKSAPAPAPAAGKKRSPKF
jgi:hypothetical protein